jgi:hypothetical protein
MRRLTLEQIYPDGIPKKRVIKRWDFPIMDFGDDEYEDSIQESQDVQGSGSSQEACGKASKGDA